MEKAITTYDEIMSAAMNLSPNEREMLAEDLMASLEGEDQATIDRLLLEEVERRDKEIQDGLVRAIPGEEVMRRLRSRYRR